MMARLITICLLGISLFACSSSERRGEVKADLSIPRQLVCYRTPKAIHIDGRLDEDSWLKTSWSAPFVDIEGAKKPKPRFDTRMKMVWDDHYLYIAATMEEPHLQASLKKRDSVIFHDNDFEVFIDPDGDSHEYCELEVNAHGTEWDLYLTRPYRDGGKAVTAWNIEGLKYAYTLDGTLNDPRDKDVGWTIEMAIPWQGLTMASKVNEAPQDGDQWRINFSRVQWQWDVVDGAYKKRKKPDGKKLPEDNWVWSPQGKISMHMPEKWGYVQFSRKPVGERAIFSPDPAHPKFELLRELFYLQWKNRRQKKSYITTLKAFREVAPDLSVLNDPSLKFQALKKSYTASILHPDGKRRCLINHRGRSWIE